MRLQVALTPAAPNAHRILTRTLVDTAAVTALLDRLLHHAHILKCGPRSWRTKVQTSLRTQEPMK